jgi:hypothetical protein
MLVLLGHRVLDPHATFALRVIEPLSHISNGFNNFGTKSLFYKDVMIGVPQNIPIFVYENLP